MSGKLIEGSLDSAPAALNIQGGESPADFEKLFLLEDMAKWASQDEDEVMEGNPISFLHPGERFDPEEDNNFDKGSDFLDSISVSSKLKYVRIKVLDESFIALIDCGASRTFINQEVKDKLLNKGFQIKKGKNISVITPLGDEESTNENMKLPILLNGHF